MNVRTINGDFFFSVTTSKKYAKMLSWDLKIFSENYNNYLKSLEFPIAKNT